MEWESGTPNFETNLQRAGELFIYSLWIQGQMADLAIFACRPDLIAPFLANPTNVPDEFAALRLTAWQKEFGSIRVSTFYRSALDGSPDLTRGTSTYCRHSEMRSPIRTFRWAATTSCTVLSLRMSSR